MVLLIDVSDVQLSDVMTIPEHRDQQLQRKQELDGQRDKGDKKKQARKFKLASLIIISPMEQTAVLKKIHFAKFFHSC